MPVDNSPRPSGAHRPSGAPGGGGGVSKALIALIAALVVGALVVLGIWLFGQGDEDEPTDDTSNSSSEAGGDESEGDDTGGEHMAVPNGMEAEPAGVVTGKAGGPELIVFEDFQCPHCKTFEEMLGDDIKQRAQDGKIQATYFPMTFMDRDMVDHSERATSAAFCAADQDKYVEFKDQVFANQKEDGSGWSDDDLKGYGKEIGLEGDALSTFEQCVQDGTYREYAKATNAAANEMGVQSTPTIYLNGQRMELSNEEAFLEELDSAGAPKKADASPSAS
ncbi:DsbA family protein [Kytococcus sedentarius]|uniref:DsbA family protein n=1 Tax=Kytococcus sedentarius TaxID=1276 RepID=UPI0035BBC159